ncbi:MAG: hypothetical protein Q9P01_16705 [Anaerolineae bacterium]|nr:hypothetical protein [Anaerolineae bacterium]
MMLAVKSLFEQSLLHVAEDELYMLTVRQMAQTPRSGFPQDGGVQGWLRQHASFPAFMIGIHAAQRWFSTGAWLMPAEKQGYSRALPLRWMPAFTEKSELPQKHAPMKECGGCC